MGSTYIHLAEKMPRLGGITRKTSSMAPSDNQVRDRAGRSRDHQDRLADLLDACGNKDRAAFREFYDLTTRFTFGLIVTIIRDRAQAEEIAQEVYVTIWKKAASFKSAKGSPLSWVATIARNRAIDRLRAERARGFVSFTDEVPDLADESQSAELSADAVTVLKVLDTLRPELRQALLLSYFKGYTNSELAEVMDVPLGTVKTWVRRGLEALREALL